MATIKAFIFDLDGVIVDTAKYHFKAWQRLAQSLGIHFHEADNEQLKGVSRKESLDKILEWGGQSLPQAQKEELMRKKNEWYLAYVKEMPASEALPGAIDFINKALALNLKIALGSASKNAVLILDKLQITKQFEAIIDGNKTTKSKPHPQVFLLGAKALGLEAAECVVFEDSVAGIAAAKAGQFKSVGIGDKETLNQAQLVVEGLHAITPVEVLNKLNG
jgi:beta-phosphoglucomutase